MPKKPNKIVDVSYDAIVHETDHAYLFDFDGTEVWLPKSWVEVDERDRVVSLPEHRAIEKEIEGYIK